MSRHSQIRMLLYEYLTDDISDSDRTLVDEHVASCAKCREEIEELRAAIASVPRPQTQPSEAQTPEYWREFLFRVEQEIQQQSSQKPERASIFDELVGFVTFHKVPVAAVAGGLAVLALALILWRTEPLPNKTPMMAERAETQKPQHSSGGQVASPEVTQASARMGDYFRRSRMLLVGITNMRVDEDDPVDLGAERKVSRDLIHEARYLKQQPMDERSAKLVGDMEKILIELANMKEHGNAPNIDIIRSGIHQENLLFKIRMAESLYDTSRFQTAGYRNPEK